MTAAPGPSPPSTTFARAVGALLLVAAVAAVAWATLRPGTPGASATALTCLVCGAEGGADVVRNVLLFVPVGAAMALLAARLRSAGALSFALSLAVESAQLWVIPGRDPSLSDVVTNTVGGLLGYLVVRHTVLWLRPSRFAARRLATASTLLWVAQLGLTAVGLQWAPPPGPYFANVLPPTPSRMRAFEGELLDRWLDGAPSVAGLVDGAAVTTGLARGELHVGATVRASYPPGLLRPLVVYFAGGWEPVLVLGQQHRDLVFRARTRSQAARFGGPTFRLGDVFPPLDGGARSGRGPITVEARVDGPLVRLSSRADDGAIHTAVVARRLSLGWTFVAPDIAGLRRLAPLLGALWLALPLVPIAFWWRRAMPPGSRATALCVAAATAGALAVMWGVTAAAGLAQPGAGELAAITLAVVLGCALERATRAPRQARPA